MSLGHPVNIRFDPETHLKYEKEAAFRNIPLSKYLREKLEKADRLNEEISAIRKEIEYLASTSSQPKNQNVNNNQEILEEIAALKKHMEFSQNQKPAKGSSENETSILLELLLLIRQIAQPQRVQLAQQELKRLNFNVWNPD